MLVTYIVDVFLRFLENVRPFFQLVLKLFFALVHETFEVPLNLAL
jgi:hypothetical protein